MSQLPSNDLALALKEVHPDLEELAAYVHALIETDGPIAVNLLLIDRSSSMDPHTPQVLELMVEIEKNMKAEADMARRTVAGVLTFASNITVEVPLTPLRRFKMPRTFDPSGATALFGVTIAGINLILGLMNVVRSVCAARGKPLPKMRCALTVLTDGEDTATQNQGERCRELSAQAREQGVILTGIAVGIDPEELARLLGFEPGYVEYVPPTVGGFRTASSHTSQVFTRSMTGDFDPVARREGPPAPVSPTGTHYGEVIPADQVPTLPRAPK